MIRPIPTWGPHEDADHRLIVDLGKDGDNLRIYVGPDSYDRNDTIKIAQPGFGPSKTDESMSLTFEEWVLEVKPYEARALVRGLMLALDQW